MSWGGDHVHLMIQRVSGTICLFLLVKMFISTCARLYGYTYVSLDTLSTFLAEQEATKAARKKFRFVEVVC